MNGYTLEDNGTVLRINIDTIDLDKTIVAQHKGTVTKIIGGSPDLRLQTNQFHAFRKLQEVDLTADKLARNIFGNCESLETVRLHLTNLDWSPSIFSATMNNVTLEINGNRQDIADFKPKSTARRSTMREASEHSKAVDIEDKIAQGQRERRGDTTSSFGPENNRPESPTADMSK